MRIVLYTILVFVGIMSTIAGLAWEALKHPQTADLVGAILAGLVGCASVGLVSWMIALAITKE